MQIPCFLCAYTLELNNVIKKFKKNFKIDLSAFKNSFSFAYIDTGPESCVDFTTEKLSL